MIDIPAIKKRIRAARVAKGIRVEEVALELGVCYNSVVKWENTGTYGLAMPTIDHLMELCILYDVSAEWLLFGEERLIFRKMAK